MGTIDDTAMENISLLVELVKKIKINSSNSIEVNIYLSIYIYK
jgi:hypothetical protein